MQYSVCFFTYTCSIMSHYCISTTFIATVLEATLQAADELNDVIFPVREETFTTEPQFQETLAQIKIPAQLLRERADQDGNEYLWYGQKVSLKQNFLHYCNTCNLEKEYNT